MNSDMKTIGIDIGSRSIEVVALQDGVIADLQRADTGYDPLAEVSQLLGGQPSGKVVVTGYGRHMLEIEWNLPTVTEIRAYAVGIGFQCPGAARFWISADRTQRRSLWIPVDASANLK